jgi:hypothetical protein
MGGKFNFNPKLSKLLCNDCQDPAHPIPTPSHHQTDTLFMSGQAKSSLRIQLAQLKEK